MARASASPIRQRTGNRTKFDEYHALGGVDFRLTPTTAIGAFGGYSSSNVSLALGNAASGDLRTVFGGLYATAAVGPLYVGRVGELQ